MSYEYFEFELSELVLHLRTLKFYASVVHSFLLCILLNSAYFLLSLSLNYLSKLNEDIIPADNYVEK